MGNHLIDGKFQSDKYPTTPRGKVPLSVEDVTAQDLLWEYAQRRRSVDAEFADDLETALRTAGYAPDGETADVDSASLLSWVTSALQGHAAVSCVCVESATMGSCVWIGIRPDAWSWFHNTVVATGNFPTGESALRLRAWYGLRWFMDHPVLEAGHHVRHVDQALMKYDASKDGASTSWWILPGCSKGVVSVGVRRQEDAVAISSLSSSAVGR